MFLPAFNGIKSVMLITSMFPDFSLKYQFSVTQNEIPRLFPDFEEFFSLTIS